MKTLLLSTLALCALALVIWLDGDCADNRARSAGRFEEAAEILEQR